MKNTTRIMNKRVRLTMGTALLIAAASASAQNGTWTNLVDGNASGSWATAGNWNNGVIADGANNTADFSTLDITNLSTVTLDGARTIGNLIFADTTPDTNWVLNTGSAGPLTLDATAPTITVNNQTATIGAVLTGVNGFSKEGTGTLRLGGANTLNGMIFINEGILQVDNNSALNVAGNSASTDRTVITNAATLEIINQRQPNNEHITVSGAGVGGTLGAIYANVGTSGNTGTRLSISLNSAANPAVTLAGDTTIRVDGTPNSSMLIGHITGADYTLTKTGGADLRIDPATGYSAGNLHVMEGILTFGNVNGILSTQTVTVDFGAAINLRNNNGLNSANSSLILNGTLDLNSRGAADGNAYNRQVGTLSGSGLITNGAAATQTFQVSSAVSNSTFNGTIQTKAANGFINVVKNGADTTLRLNGANSYGGLTTVNAGTLLVNGAHTGSGGYLVNAAGTLGGSGTISSVITNNGTIVAGDPSSSGTLTVLSDILGNFSDTIIISNAILAVSGFIGDNISATVGTMNLTNGTLDIPLRTLGASAFVSTLNVDGAVTIKFSMDTPLIGQFPIISYASLGGLAGFAGLSLVSPPGITATLVDTGTSIDVNITAIPAITWEGAPGGTWDIGVGNWKSGATYTETGGSGPFVVFDDTATGTTSVSLGSTLSPQGVTVNNSSLSYTFTGSGKVSGPGGIAKQGSGTLTVVNSGNDFTGGVNINAGTLQLGNGGTTGDLGSGAVANVGTLALNRSDSFTLSNTVSGNGAITKAGAGTAAVPVSGDSSGAVTVNAGTLLLGPVGTSKFSGDVTGSGGFGVNGAGTVILSSFNNTYAGGTFITGGTLQFGDEFGSGSAPAGNISNDGGLALSLSTTLGNNISGSGGVSVVNNQFVTLTGVNTYSGPTAVEGNLTISSAAAFPAASVLQLGNPDAGTTVGTINFDGFNPVLGGLRAGAHSAGSEVSQINLNSAPQTLTINGNVLIGVSQPNGAIVNFSVVDPTFSSSCTLSVVTNGGTIQLGYSASPGGTLAENWDVDLTSLGTFHADLGATGLLSLGTVNTGNSGVDATVPVQNFSLAASSNSLNMGTITIGGGEKHNSPHLRLGPGTNVINADTINIGTGGRDQGNFVFQTPGSGSVGIRGYAGGSSRANLNIGTGTQGTGGPAVNQLNFAGNYADLMLGAVVIGNQPNRNGTWDQTFSFDQGVLDALSVSMSGGKSGSANPGTSTMNIGGGTASLGPVSLTASAAAGNLNITGGSVTVHGISDTGAGTGTLDVNSADLNIDIQGFGNPASAPVSVDVFNANGTVNLGVNGSGFAVGQFELIKYSGAIGGTGFGALNLVSLPSGVTGSLSNNTANLSVDLVITAAPPTTDPNPTNITFSVSGGNLNLSWPSSHLGWTLQCQTNSLGVGLSTNWVDIAGSQSVTSTNLPVATEPTVFYRLKFTQP